MGLTSEQREEISRVCNGLAMEILDASHAYGAATVDVFKTSWPDADLREIDSHVFYSITVNIALKIVGGWSKATRERNVDVIPIVGEAFTKATGLPFSGVEVKADGNHRRLNTDSNN